MVSNLRCPDCEAIGRDKNGDHLFLLKDGITYMCRTDYHEKKFYTYKDGELILKSRSKNGKKNKNPFIKEDIDSYPIVDFDYRGIEKEVYEKYRVRYSVDSERGEPEYLYFPVYKKKNKEHIGYHIRGIKRKTFSNTDGIRGMNTLLFYSPDVDKSRKAVITEGHLDALSVYQALKKKYPSFDPNVFSTNNGVGDLKSFINNIDELKNYEEIILCFDDDEAGNSFTSRIARMIGERVKIMKIPSFKDANAALQEGREKSIVAAFFSAEQYKPSGVILLDNIRNRIIDKPSWGLDYPFEKLNIMTYGLRKGEIISIGAGAGIGKSSFIIEIIKKLVFTHREKIGIFSLEETPEITGKKLVGSILNKKIHLPDCEYNEEDVVNVLDSIKDFIYLYDHQGYISWENIEEVIRFQATIGCSYFFIDPITALTSHLSASETNDTLNKMASDLSSLVHTLNITIFLVSHLNNSKKSKSHDEGGRVYGSDFSGSRALYRWSNLMLGLSRNVVSDDEKVRNKVLLQVIKNRFSGETGSFELYYDKEQGVLKESVEEFTDEDIDNLDF